MIPFPYSNTCIRSSTLANNESLFSISLLIILSGILPIIPAMRAQAIDVDSNVSIIKSGFAIRIELCIEGPWELRIKREVMMSKQKLGYNSEPEYRKRRNRKNFWNWCWEWNRRRMRAIVTGCCYNHNERRCIEDLLDNFLDCECLRPSL